MSGRWQASWTSAYLKSWAASIRQTRAGEIRYCKNETHPLARSSYRPLTGEKEWSIVQAHQNTSGTGGEGAMAVSPIAPTGLIINENISISFSFVSNKWRLPIKVKAPTGGSGEGVKRVI